jgi:hypothetical protein
VAVIFIPYYQVRPPLLTFGTPWIGNWIWSYSLYGTYRDAMNNMLLPGLLVGIVFGGLAIIELLVIGVDSLTLWRHIGLVALASFFVFFPFSHATRALIPPQLQHQVYVHHIKNQFLFMAVFVIGSFVLAGLLKLIDRLISRTL